MFANLERAVETFHVEALTEHYLLRAVLNPLGGLSVFINDRSRDYITFHEVDLVPTAAARQLRGVRRASMGVNKPSFLYLALLQEAEKEKVQILDSKRPVVFYLGPVIVRGQLHVNVDTSNEDLLDVSRDFYPLTEASVFPLQPMAVAPTRQVPLLFVNRLQVQAYHPADE